LSASAAPAAVDVFGHTWYWPWNFIDLPTIWYTGNPLTFNLPPLTLDQLCYAVGVNTGCSGCVQGTKGLCAFVSAHLSNTDARYFNCIAKDLALELQLAESQGFADALTLRGLHDIRNESHLCPINPDDAPIIRAPLYSPPLGGLQTLGWELTSLIQNTYHEMAWADVPSRPWVVDRTSGWGGAGNMILLGYGVAIVVAGAGRDPTVGRVDCAALNDPDQLNVVLPLGNATLANQTLFKNLMIGMVNNPRSRWCANFAYGAYLSSRCPQYGRAISGISATLLQQFFLNCQGRGNSVSPLLIGGLPYAALPFVAVPDSTPFALFDVPVLPNEQWEAWVGIEEVDHDWNWGVPAVIFGLP